MMIDKKKYTENDLLKIVGLLGIFLLWVVGCQPQMAESTLTPSNTEQSESEPPAALSFPTSTASSQEAAPNPTQTTAVSTLPIDDDEAKQIMDTLLQGTPGQIQKALDRITAVEDERFIPVLIEAFRGGQLRILRITDSQALVSALEELSGQTFGPDWPAWVEWYGNTDITPPPGFVGWKGAVLSQIDPRFGEFLQEELPIRLRPEEIQWGGVLVDGIPALDNPQMLEADKATYMEPENAVFGLAINGEARAYPLRILDWHEMANDVIGGVPVSLAYCTLCGAAVAYDGRGSDGETYTFGSSGFLYRSNKLMYDRQTNTLWNQLTGEPVLGELAGTDVTLDLLPVVLTTWKEWQNQHPDTLVVDIETGFPRNYTPGAAYGGYFADVDTMFPVPQRNDRLPTKSQIYALRLDGLPKAYPIDLLIAEGVVNDTLGETDVVLIAPADPVLVDGDNQYVGEVTYQAGAEVRAYDRGEHTFSAGSDDETLLDENGRSWQITEDALISPDGKEAPRLGGHLAYWFGWYAFFPNTLVYGEE
jgi:hypothetical protein